VRGREGAQLTGSREEVPQPHPTQSISVAVLIA
jgi:hypothetical protein